MYRIGVDIGGTNIALGILDEGWELLAQKSVPFQRGGEIVAAIIAQQIRAMLAETGIAESMLECIGIAVPGSITPDGQLVLDATGKKSGRGAYVCRDAQCLKKARKSRALDRMLEVSIPDEVYEALERQMETEA